jgi:hypothetical protein
MMNSLSVIRRSVGSRSLDVECGFIVNSSDSFLLAAVVADNCMSGLSLIRRDTVISMEKSEDTQFVRRTLLLSGCIVPDFVDFPVQSLASAMTWLMNERLICGIFFEAEKPRHSAYGKIVSVSDEVFVMHQIDPSGKWDDEPTEFDMAPCTRMVFLGEYELSLMLYALDAAARAG